MQKTFNSRKRGLVADAEAKEQVEAPTDIGESQLNTESAESTASEAPAQADTDDAKTSSPDLVSIGPHTILGISQEGESLNTSDKSTTLDTYETCDTTIHVNQLSALQMRFC